MEITPSLIENIRGSGKFLSLVTGEIQDSKPKKGIFDENLVSQVHSLYLSGNLYPAKYAGVFGLRSPTLLSAFRKRNHKTLNRKETQQIYGDEINALREATSFEKYGVSNPAQVEEFKERAKVTNLEKYGTESIFQSDHFKEMAKDANLAKYGVGNVMQSKEVREKLKGSMISRYGVHHNWARGTLREKHKFGFEDPQVKAKAVRTMIDRYGHESAWANPKVKAKAVQTMVDRYGCEHSLQSSEIRERMMVNSVRRYGVDHPLKANEIRSQIKSTMLDRYGVEYPMQNDDILIKVFNGRENADELRERFSARFDLERRIKEDPNNEDLKNELRDFIIENYSGTAFYNHLTKNGFRDRQFREPSRIEIIFKNWLLRNNIEFEENVYLEWLTHPETQRRRELDFYLPKFKLAIELNGDYTHSIEFGKDEGYHAFKFQKCFENGVTLLMFTETEILEDFELVEILMQFHIGMIDSIADLDYNPQCELRFGLKSQEINESTKVEAFEVGVFTHFYPV